MKNTKDVFVLLPTLGIFTFLGLSIYAASMYPGGSQADVNSVGFDWANNFWCNLMSENGLNGMRNPARPVAIFATVILCASMTLYFFLFANFFENNRVWKMIIRISGPLAMLSAIWVFTKYHDIMTTILSVFGGLVMIGVIRALHKNKLTVFKIWGMVCVVLVILNNFFYYKEDLIQYLPVIQKMTFISILAWTVGLNLHMKNRVIPQHRR